MPTASLRASVIASKVVCSAAVEMASSMKPGWIEENAAATA